jgi:hypothetical protein
MFEAINVLSLKVLPRLITDWRVGTVKLTRPAPLPTKYGADKIPSDVILASVFIKHPSPSLA